MSPRFTRTGNFGSEGRRGERSNVVRCTKLWSPSIGRTTCSPVGPETRGNGPRKASGVRAGKIDGAPANSVEREQLIWCVSAAYLIASGNRIVRRTHCARSPFVYRHRNGLISYPSSEKPRPPGSEGITWEAGPFVARGPSRSSISPGSIFCDPEKRPRKKRRSLV